MILVIVQEQNCFGPDRMMVLGPSAPVCQSWATCKPKVPKMGYTLPREHCMFATIGQH